MTRLTSDCCDGDSDPRVAHGPGDSIADGKGRFNGRSGITDSCVPHRGHVICPVNGKNKCFVPFDKIKICTDFYRANWVLRLWVFSGESGFTERDRDGPPSALHI